MNIITLLLAIVMAVTPVVTVIDVNKDLVTVDINGEAFVFYGDGFEVSEEIRIVFINDMILEVLP